MLVNRVKFYLIVILSLCLGVYMVYVGTAKIVITGSWRNIISIMFVFGMLCGVLLVHFFRWYNKKMDAKLNILTKNIDSAKLGVEGEKIVAGWLNQLFPKDRYAVLPNVVLPGHKFDIDFIVVGPKGVIMLEVKNFTEQRCFSEDEYFYIKNGRKYVLPASDDPRQEVRRHLSYLRKQFENIGLDSSVRISRAVVFLNEKDVVFEGKTGIYIANGFDSLERFTEGITEDLRYDASFCHRIEEVLEYKG